MTCNDSTRNGDETDVDCGGPVCAPCANDKACIQASDCQSGVCTGDVCQAPTNNDNVQNGDETDVDCGGSSNACDDGEACLAANDCQSEVCTGDICQAPANNDNVQNGDETDVDCLPEMPAMMAKHCGK